MKIILREWRESDAEAVALAADNKKIADNLRDVFPHPYTLADAGCFISDCIAQGENGQLTRAIEIDGKAVGSIAVYVQSDVARRSAELGYWLKEDLWGKGIMPAAVREICRLAFEKFDLLRIYAEPFERNIASRRVLEKCGFRLEGVMQNSVYKNGEVLSSCMYALLNGNN